MRNLDNYFLFPNAEEPGQFLALPKYLAETLFYAEFQGGAAPALTYANILARVNELDAADELEAAAIFWSEARVIDQRIERGKPDTDQPK